MAARRETRAAAGSERIWPDPGKVPAPSGKARCVLRTLPSSPRTLMPRPRIDPLVPRLAALACAGLAALGGGCLGHVGPVPLDAPGFSLDPERGDAPFELNPTDVELVVSGPSFEPADAERLRQHVAAQLALRLGPPAAGAARVSTRLFVTSWRAPLVATGPYKEVTLALETEVPGAHVVRTGPRAVRLDNAELFALEHVGFAAATAEGALALTLASLGLAFAGNDPEQAAYTVLFSAVPVASAAGITAFLGATLRGYAIATESERASDALLEVLRAHAADLRADAARRDGKGAPPAAAQGESAVTLVLHDELACLSRVDLERDLEALVPASSSARFLLDAAVTAGARDEVRVLLRLSEARTSAPLAERELTVARADCATLPRAIARIVRTHVEAVAPGAAP